MKFVSTRVIAVLAVGCWALGGATTPVKPRPRADGAAPKPLYRDPVCDGAADPVVINSGDAVVFAGTATDSEVLALDELLVVITSEEDATVQLFGAVDPSGDFSVTAPAGTFVDAADPYLVRVTVVDQGGLTAESTLQFEVSP